MLEATEGGRLTKRIPLSCYLSQQRMKSRFGFGRNWKKYLSTMSDADIKIARESLLTMISDADDTVHGKRFLDVGCGSGLFSLCARSAGCKVVSFDYDPEAVSCAKELKDRYYPGDSDWTVLQGSVLDKEFLTSLNTYDIVYAWGVLHHTGDMWTAMDNVAGLTKNGGTLCLAIYNDCGWRSRIWHGVKRFYNFNIATRVVTSMVFVPCRIGRMAISSIRQRTNLFAAYKRERGMHIVTDLLDWIGGYPYEYAKWREVVEFYSERGFIASTVTPTEGTGNHQFVLVHNASVQ